MQTSTTTTKELTFLTEWCIFIRQFERDDLAETLYFEEDIKDIQTAFAENNLSGLRMAFVDYNSAALDFPTKDLTHLNRRLKERFGKTLYDMDAQHQKRINSILKRGSVRNDDEFRRVQSHIENIWQLPDRKHEFETLQEMNFSYEQSKVL